MKKPEKLPSTGSYGDGYAFNGGKGDVLMVQVGWDSQPLGGIKYFPKPHVSFHASKTICSIYLMNPRKLVAELANEEA